MKKNKTPRKYNNQKKKPGFFDNIENAKKTRISILGWAVFAFILARLAKIEGGFNGRGPDGYLSVEEFPALVNFLINTLNFCGAVLILAFLLSYYPFKK